MEKKIKSIITFEMLGRPPEHITETMNKLVDVICAEKGIKKISSKVHDIKKIENTEENKESKEDLYSTFAEIEIESEDLARLFFIAFRYLPAHVEIIEPENINMRNVDLNAIITEILISLHNYDAIAKSALMNNRILKNKLDMIMEKISPQSQKISMPVPEISYGKKEETPKEKPAKKSKKKK
jgi:hypothetical protein